jgi:hypothetical protein
MPTSQPDDAIRQEPDKAVSFLQRWYPPGPWVLSAIDPNRKGIDTKSFKPNQLDELRAWLVEHGERKHWNLYFTPNAVTRAFDSKPEATDIAAMLCLHVDLDPRAGEDLAAERARIFALLADPTSKGVPRPSVVVDSGGGGQAFWRLKVPHLLDQTREMADSEKLYSKRLGQILEGDSTENVDRLMRLPGTVNYPDPRKIKKGRVPALAKVIECNDTTFDLAQFEKAQTTAPKVAAGGLVVEIGDKVPRLASVDDLPPTVGDKAKVVLVQGHDPDEPNKFGSSRSEWLFHVCCQLVRAEVKDDLIYGIITDPAWAISESVLDKGRGAHAYAVRQIRRAREEAEEPMLRELNDKHAVVGSIGGKCRITTFERSALGEHSREMLQLHSQADFLLRYSNRTVDMVVANGKVVSKRAGQWWLDHPMRRQYEGIVFDPSREGDADGYMNLWRGFSVAPQPGSYPLFRELVEKVLASGDATVAEYLWKWTAWLIQNPHLPAEVAIVFRSDQGTGKGTFARTLGRLFGQHFAHVSSSREVTGNFNAHMRDCVMLFADEAFLGGSHDAIGTLKRIITEPTIRVEQKGVDSAEWPNRLHVIAASNEEWVVPAGPDERRFVVLDVSDARKEDHEWFAALDAELEGGGLAALLHDMLSADLGDWHPRRGRPQTAALTDQKVSSLRALEAQWFEYLQSGELPFGVRDGECVWLQSTWFLDHVNRILMPRKRISTNSLSALLGKPQSNHERNKAKGMGFEKRREEYGKGLCGYVIPPLAEARRRWDERRFPFPWEPAERWTLGSVISERVLG